MRAVRGGFGRSRVRRRLLGPAVDAYPRASTHTSERVRRGMKVCAVFSRVTAARCGRRIRRSGRCGAASSPVAWPWRPTPGSPASRSGRTRRSAGQRARRRRAARAGRRGRRRSGRRRGPTRCLCASRGRRPPGRAGVMSPCAVSRSTSSRLTLLQDPRGLRGVNRWHHEPPSCLRARLSIQPKQIASSIASAWRIARGRAAHVLDHQPDLVRGLAVLPQPRPPLRAVRGVDRRGGHGGHAEALAASTSR